MQNLIFFNSQRKLNANNVKINALNTYIMGKVMRRIMGDDLHEESMRIIESERVKANYYISRKTEDMPKEKHHLLSGKMMYRKNRIYKKWSMSNIYKKRKRNTNIKIARTANRNSRKYGLSSIRL